MPQGRPIVEIYTLSDPRDGEVRYVGKAVSAVARLKSHLRDARRRDTPLYRWIRKMIREGVIPQVNVTERCSEDDWRGKEVAAIAAERAVNPRLLNVADGGDEPHCPMDVRANNARNVTRNIMADPESRRVRALKAQIGTGIARGWTSEATKSEIRRLAIKYPNHFGVWANI